MWVHHKLCKDLFCTPREITYQKLFGAYLHSLLAHAPRQYEIICLRSVNTENQECMFQQAKKIGTNTSGVSKVGHGRAFTLPTATGSVNSVLVTDLQCCFLSPISYDNFCSKNHTLKLSLTFWKDKREAN